MTCSIIYWYVANWKMTMAWYPLWYVVDSFGNRDWSVWKIFVWILVSCIIDTHFFLSCVVDILTLDT